MGAIILLFFSCGFVAGTVCVVRWCIGEVKQQIEDNDKELMGIQIFLSILVIGMMVIFTLLSFLATAYVFMR